MDNERQELAESLVGSISTGTLKMEDLFPKVMDALDDLAEKCSFLPGSDNPRLVALQGRKDDALGCIERSQKVAGFYEMEDAQFEYEAMTDLISEFLSAYGIEGVRFGALEGDGADIGFWFDTED